MRSAPLPQLPPLTFAHPCRALGDPLVCERVDALREREIEARFQDSAQLGTTVGMVAAGQGITLSARSWLAGVEGIVWIPLSDVRIDIRTAAAWRAGNRSPLLRTLVDLLPAAAEHAGPEISLRSSASG